MHSCFYTSCLQRQNAAKRFSNMHDDLSPVLPSLAVVDAIVANIDD